MYMFSVLDFRERNATVARKWAELTEDERKGWAAKAEAVCSSSMQVHGEQAVNTIIVGTPSNEDINCLWLLNLKKNNWVPLIAPNTCWWTCHNHFTNQETPTYSYLGCQLESFYCTPEREREREYM